MHASGEPYVHQAGRRDPALVPLSGDRRRRSLRRGVLALRVGDVLPVLHLDGASVILISFSN